jgi:hypothetical protein
MRATSGAASGLKRRDSERLLWEPSRSSNSFRADSTLLGVIRRLRPATRPHRRAAARPARVRSANSSRSICAREAMTWKTNRPDGVVVPMPSVRLRPDGFLETYRSRTIPRNPFREEISKMKKPGFGVAMAGSRAPSRKPSFARRPRHGSLEETAMPIGFLSDAERARALRWFFSGAIGTPERANGRAVEPASEFRRCVSHETR